MKMNNERISGSAIVPGSFDPITLGHMDVIRRAASLFESVWLALMVNPSKSYHFDRDTRIALAESAVSELPNVKVIYDEGMLAELALRLGADAIVKGIRNEKDLSYEIEMARYNKEKSGVETIFLPSLCDEVSRISSTLVRSCFDNGELDRAASLLPPGAMDIIRKRGYK